MKTKNGFKKGGLIILSIILFLVGVYIAFNVYLSYSVIVRGVLGLTFICLLFFFVKQTGIDISTDALLMAPNKARYIVLEFIIAIFSVWATMQVIETYFFFFPK